MCVCVLTGCGDTTEQTTRSSISSEELSELVSSTESTENTLNVEVVDNAAEISTVEDSSNQNNESLIVTQYLINYDWDSLPTKKSFKELNVPVPIPTDIEELLSGMYINPNGDVISINDVVPDTSISVHYNSQPVDIYKTLNITVGYADQSLSTESSSGFEKYIDYCINNNIWHIDYNTTGEYPYSLMDVLNDLGCPDRVVAYNENHEQDTFIIYNILIVYEYDSLSIIFETADAPNKSDRDKFTDWLSVNRSGYVSNVKMKVYSNGYIKEKINDGKSLEEVYRYGNWDVQYTTVIK